MNEYTIIHLANGTAVITKYEAANPIDAISYWQNEYPYSAKIIISITRTN